MKAKLPEILDELMQLESLSKWKEYVFSCFPLLKSEIKTTIEEINGEINDPDSEVIDVLGIG